MTAASSSDILRAVERWARAAHRGDLTVFDDGVWVGHEWRKLSPAIALAWALLVESGAESVDVGRCPACVARSGTRRLATTEWRFIEHERGPHPYAAMAVREALRDFAAEGYSVEHDERRAPLPEFEGRVLVSIRLARPCPACNGTGRETIPAARILLDAAEPCRACDDTGTVPAGNDFAACPDCPARQALRAHADHIQAAAHPLGDLLAWALRLWTGEPTDCGPCPACLGFNPLRRAHGFAEPRCPECSGAGRQLGHPHTAEAVRWLEWLTWARELAAERETQAPPLRDEVAALARVSVLSYAYTFDLVSRAIAAGATYVERQRLGVHGMVMLVNAFESGALARGR